MISPTFVHRFTSTCIIYWPNSEPSKWLLALLTNSLEFGKSMITQTGRYYVCYIKNKQGNGMAWSEDSVGFHNSKAEHEYYILIQISYSSEQCARFCCCFLPVQWRTSSCYSLNIAWQPKLQFLIINDKYRPTMSRKGDKRWK